MNRLSNHIVPFVFLLLLSTLSFAQKPSFDWGVGLDYIFDNAEYSRSSEAFDKSGTLHGVRLVPTVGIMLPQGENVTHRVRLGIDLVKYAGEQLSAGSVFNEVTLYYDCSLALSDGGTFEALAGCFPRKYFGGSYRGPVFDGPVLFKDRNVEGMLFKYSNSDLHAELGLDWMGRYGDDAHPARRERFQILTSGDWRFAGPFHLNWVGSFYHYANSPDVYGVVDNHLINPMLEWRPSTALDLLSLSAGGIVTYQCDRAYEDFIRAPGGFYSRQAFEKWHVGIHNSFYCGSDLQPFLAKYGTELYPGQPMFHTLSARPSCADELAIVFRPCIASWLDLSVAAVFDFGTAYPELGTGFYRGCRQVVLLRIDIERFPSEICR